MLIPKDFFRSPMAMRKIPQKQKLPRALRAINNSGIVIMMSSNCYVFYQGPILFEDTRERSERSGVIKYR